MQITAGCPDCGTAISIELPPTGLWLLGRSVETRKGRVRYLFKFDNRLIHACSAAQGKVPGQAIEPFRSED